MALVFPQSSESWTESVRGQVASLLNGRVPQNLKETERSALIRVFRLNCRQADQEGVRRGSQPVGWRALIFSGGVPLAAIDLSGEPGGDLQVDSCKLGDALAPLVKGLDAAVEAAEQAGDREIRFLESPALLFSAIWLSGADSQQDLLIPLVPLDDLQPFHPHPLGEVEPHLKAAAKAELATKNLVHNLALKVSGPLEEGVQRKSEV